ncbi:hypothetical protein [Leisingera sp. F5]|uniref:hypothetical protein n=1 Tax=Leisingera sp. F5 TaxID=1813816 RepID=UPI0025B84F6D|nr:hypothetical protein [Leisingera sp. F5]
MSKINTQQSISDWRILSELQGIPRASQFVMMGGEVRLVRGEQTAAPECRWSVQLHGFSARGATLRDALDSWIVIAGLSPFGMP